jgi:alanine dehydrogenase
VLVIDDAAVRAALPMPTAVEVMREAMRAYGEGSVYQPSRTVLQPPGGGYVFIKPAAATAALGLKVITFFPSNAERGLPAISGFVALFDSETGVPVALLDGGAVTEIRTGAVSAVATDVLARADAGDLALLGAGVQARAHLEALAVVRPLRRVRVWSHRSAGAEAFVDWAAERGHRVQACATAREAVAGADLVCTVSSAREPVLDGDWLSPGTHINAVGAFEATTRELDTNVVAKARVVVDDRDGAAAAAGDLLIPVREGALPSEWTFPELGELLAGTRVDGRAGDDDVTLYESLGLAVQDVAAAAQVVTASRERGLGIDVPF